MKQNNPSFDPGSDSTAKSSSKSQNSLIVFIGTTIILMLMGWSFYISLVDRSKLYDEIVMVTDQHHISTKDSEQESIADQKVTADLDDVVIWQDNSRWKKITNQKFGYQYDIPDLEVANLFRVETHFSTSSLSDYVNSLWYINSTEINEYIPNKSVSDIERRDINSQESYSFTVTGSFSFSELSGYIISSPKNKFVFLETESGVKIIVNYPVEKSELFDMALSTFIIDSSLIPEKLLPGFWEDVVSDNLSFSVPTNIFQLVEASIERVTHSTSSIKSYSFNNPDYGNLSVNISGENFDKESFDERNRDRLVFLGEVFLADRYWYRYKGGDAGCVWGLTRTGFDGGLVEVTFSACYDDVYPIYEEEDLVNEVINSFKFMGI
ncbi:MAG: hypothetical protein R3B53_01595 [Candidatus Paceibacterota bacterium]